MTTHSFPKASRALAFTGAALLLLASPGRAQQRQVVRISLDDALRAAEARSEAVGVARAGLSRASGNRLISRSQGLPQLNATAGYTKTLKSQFEVFANTPAPDPTAPRALCTPEIPANATQAQRDAALAQAATCSSGGGIDFSSAGFGAKNQWALGLNAAWNVFTGGRISGQTSAATAQEQSATIEVQAQRAQAKLDVAQAYYDAALTDRLVAIAEASLKQTELVLEQTKLGREVGDVSEFDLLRAQVTRDNQRPALIQARSNREVAYLRLKQILEIPADDSIALATGLESDSASATLSVAATAAAANLAAASRAPVRQLEQAVIAQEGLLRAAKAERMPQVQVVSGYQQLYFPNQLLPDFGQARQNWTVGVQTSLPIFTAGRIRGSTMVAQANLDETRQRLNQTRELTDLDTRVAISNLEEAQAAFLASAGTAEQAQRALDIDQLRFREGISTQTDLAQSRLLFEQATANRAVAARNLAVARLRVQLLGDLPLQLGGSTNPGSTQRQQD
jgi:outer membrane protein TolC